MVDAGLRFCVFAVLIAVQRVCGHKKALSSQRGLAFNPTFSVRLLADSSRR